MGLRSARHTDSYFPRRDKIIWERRIVGKETLAAIGADFNLSKERIRQIVFREEMKRIRRENGSKGK